MPPPDRSDRDGALERAWRDLALGAAGLGSFDWDLTTGRLVWDDRLVDLFGYERDGFSETIEAFNDRVHPDDRARVTHALTTAIETVDDYGAEYRIVRPDGTVRWIEARGRALPGEAGRAARVVGVAYDTTELREGEARLTRVIESMSTAFYLLDADWRFRYLNAQAERMLSRTRGELLGRMVWEVYPGMIGTGFERDFRKAVATGEPVSFQAYLSEPVNGWYQLRAVPGPDGLLVHFLDVTSLVEAAAATELAARTESLLARVASELTQTLSPADAAARLAAVVVGSAGAGTLGEWCVISLVDDELPGPPSHRLRDVGVAHADPELQRLLRTRSGLLSRTFDDLAFLEQMLATAQPVFVEGDAVARLEPVLGSGDAGQLFSRLAPAAVAVLPLVARGRVLGVMTIGRDRPSPAATRTQDRAVATQIAARAAIAFDNARLYQAERRMAAGLQRSLFTRPPQPDQCEIVVRYEPAAEAAQVGGDWYDAFLQDDGATVLVIGDVVGHDVEAAAAMGQLRGLLRGIAATTGEGPARVLARLDSAMQLLQVETTATAVVARLEQEQGEYEDGVTRLRWSSAGHPPPMVVHPDGSVAVLGMTFGDDGELLAGADADLLLGMDAGTPRTESQVALLRGSTVLLFTDGLVERRDQAVEDGLVKLQRVLAGSQDRPLGELCDAVLASMLGDEPEDDVAIAAVRLHPLDRPRPPTAGPMDTPDVVD